MWQRFTERARKVVFYAQEEAGRLGDNYVSTEHLLLGMIRENDSVAARILDRLGISLESIRSEVSRAVTRGDGRLGQDMQLTPRAKRVIDLAYDEARLLANNYIGTEHLLLGLIREGEGLAARVLAKLGVELDRTRAEVSSVQERPADQVTPAEPVPPFDANKLSHFSRVRSESTLILPKIVAAADRLGMEPGLEHYLVAILENPSLKAAKVLAKLGITMKKLEKAIKDIDAASSTNP
jgi:ATP-dependent Clp protease ATP-binding subunit ClpA